MITFYIGFYLAKVIFFLEKAILIPKIEETHHTAKQLTKPSLLQLEVDVLSAAAKHMKLIEEIMRPPFPYLRLHVALVDRHLRGRRVAQLLQIRTHVFLARDETRVHDMGVVGSYLGVFHGYSVDSAG